MTKFDWPRSTLELIQYDESLNISDNVNYVHEESDGFGMAPLHRLSERGPLQHGDSDMGYRLDPRLINLVIGIVGDNWDDIYARRELLLDFLNPETVTHLRFTTPGGVQRQIDVYVISGPIYSSTDFVGFFIQKAGFTLKAPDPSWYDPEETYLRFALGGGGGTFAVPMVVPHEVGSSTLSQAQVVDYQGTTITYPVIQITGPIVNPKIVNQSTGETLDFAGSDIDVGDYFVIDTRYGHKTVVDSLGANQIALLSADSDLATFHLRRGSNTLLVTGTGVTIETAVELRFYTRYLGF